jgi:transcriptional regulator with XRE-family HTH domain
MGNLLEELRETMEQQGLSPEEAARHCEVGFRSVYRWLKGESKPSAVYRRAIRLGIKRMKRMPSVRTDKKD